MSSGGKGGGSQQKQYNRFGTLCVPCGDGPFDGIRAVHLDGKALWEGTITRGAEHYIDLTSLFDASNFLPGGYARFYWGTEDQPADAYLASVGHPPYAGTAYLVLRHFLFGLERNTPRDVAVIPACLPKVPTTIVEAAHNVFDEGQCNPVAAAAWLLLTIGFPAALFGTSAWKAAASKAYTNRKLTFFSPLVTTFEDAGAVLTDLLAMVDGMLRWRGDKLEIVLREWGAVVEEAPTFDARHYAEGAEPAGEGPGLDEVPTGFDVGFVDRDKNYKEASELVPNAWAVKMRQGDVDRRELPRPHVMRREQAALIGAQAVRQSDQPRSTYEIVLRSAEVAMTADEEPRPLLPGDKAFFDIDPVPGGAALGQLCIIEERTDRPNGEVALKVTTDTLLQAIPYTPGWVAAEPQDAVADPIAHALVIPLPPSAWEFPLGVAVLATRPERNTTRMRVHFDNDDEGDFPELGIQTGFAARATVPAGADDEETVLRFVLTDGADGPDAYLAGLTPESEVAARADRLLAILANVDGNGRVVIDADGRPEMEFVSIIGRTAVTADTHDYTVLRARRGTSARAWANTAQVWIVPIENLAVWRHPDMMGLLATGGIGYIRLTAATPFAEDDTPEIPERTFTMPIAFDIAPRIAWTSPAGSAAETDGDGDITISGEVTDRQGDLASLRIDSRRDDGTSETTHLNAAFPATGARSFNLALNFAGHASEYRVYILRIEARDQQGNPAIQSRTITRPPTGTPATPAPPIFTPGDGWSFFYSQVVNIASAGGTQVEWVSTFIGSATPAGGTLAPGNSVDVNITSSRRIWARAKSGSTYSPWVYADYYKEVDNTGTTPLIP